MEMRMRMKRREKESERKGELLASLVKLSA